MAEIKSFFISATDVSTDPGRSWDFIKDGKGIYSQVQKSELIEFLKTL